MTFHGSSLTGPEIIGQKSEDNPQRTVGYFVKTIIRPFSFNYGNFCPRSDRPGHQLRT
jgi:hypothetical protein